MLASRIILLGSLLSLVGICGAAEAVKPVMLFDGHTLDGWQATSKSPTLIPVWKANDGVIDCQGAPNGYLRTAASFENYSLHVEWRWPEKSGNSGIFLHINGEDKVWPMCLEVQVKVGQSGNVNSNGGSHFAELQTPKHIFPHRAADSEKSAGEWNIAEIVCRGDTVSITINGVLQNEISGASVSKGPIGLQAEGTPIQFRNISLTPIPLAAK